MPHGVEMAHNKKLALVTGSSRGIGMAIARRCLESGYRVIGVARASQPALAGLEWIQTDLSTEQGCRMLLEHPALRGQTLDLLVNNAGLAGGQEQVGGQQDWELWQRIVSLNLSASYHLLSGLSEQLRPEVGRVVQIGSVLSLRAVPDQPAYTAAKHGLVGLTKSMALRLASRGITVNLICPGWTRTEMAEQRARELGTALDDLIANVPLGRWIEAEEIAELVIFLASKAAQNITGQCLVIDGGASL